ncbi:TonB-dependent receptor [Sphingomonas hylomeconis]|uniref:TonB-dependent receptor n=1 Tax=Sphingomonas hylomeconis TaxID=1395958 RepID=A0ABV7SZL5_9SPHN|nr:TonB-dependent receptor [Sphingomonas hylomeconis]
MKHRDVFAVSALALIAAMPAYGQESSRPLAAAPQDDSTSRADQAGDNQDQDIIVTATKRELTLLDTPVAVSVTSAQTIEQAQIRDLNDLQSVVPSLRVAQLQSSANTNFIIRGFGNGANNAGIEPSVGVFVDGVYRSRSAAQITDLPNLKRVEVLRGPQSTLFGKNASAGIISVVTAEPSFEFGGAAEATYGNYNAVVLKADVTGPISETLAFSLAGNYNRRDGYVKDLALNDDTNNRNRYGFRGQLLFQPSSTIKFRLIGDYDKIDENCCAVGNIIDGPTGNAVRALGGQIDSANPFSNRVYTNRASTNNIKNYGISLQADFDLTDQLTLTSISSYRGVKLRTNQDSDFTSADIIGANANRTDIDTYTQELRLASNFDGPFNFLLGGFLFHEKINVEDDLVQGTQFRQYVNLLSNNAIPTVEAILGVPVGTFFPAGTGLFDKFRYRDNSYSIFGQADYEITDGLTFTAGLNYTRDKKKVASDVTSTDAFSALDFTAIGRQVLTQQAIATTVGQALGLPGQANAAQIQGFAAAQPAIFGQIQAGAAAFGAANQSNAAVNPLLALRALQFTPPFLNFPNAVESGKTDDDNLSYTLRLAYKANSNLSVYATHATGFKASSFNLSRDSRPFASDFIPGSPVTNPATSPIRAAGLALPNLTTGSRYAGPEKSSVYEVGIKGQYSNFAFNIAVFKQYIKGFQSNVFTGTGFSLLNAEKESVFGVEFDGSVTPVRPLSLNLAVTYLDPKYDSFDNGGAIGPALTVVPTNLTGTRPGDIPEWSVSTGATYTQEINPDLKLLLRGDYQFESKTRIANGALDISRKVSQINLAATLEFANGLQISAWGRNVNNQRYLITFFPAVAQTGSISGYPSQPRTYGLTGRFKF